MITKVSLEKAIKIYEERIENDFPDEEVPPIHVYERCIKENIFECYTFTTTLDSKVYEDVGYLVTRKGDDIVFILVLAVDKNIRGKGLGKIMLNEFIDFIKNEYKLIILEAENPEEKEISKEEKHIREKRIKFYTDLDFKITENLKYLLVKIDYKILYLNLKNKDEKIFAKDAMNIMERVYENVLRNRAWLEMEEIN